MPKQQSSLDSFFGVSNKTKKQKTLNSFFKKGVVDDTANGKENEDNSVQQKADDENDPLPKARGSKRDSPDGEEKKPSSAGRRRRFVIDDESDEDEEAKTVTSTDEKEEASEDALPTNIAIKEEPENKPEKDKSKESSSPIRFQMDLLLHFRIKKIYIPPDQAIFLFQSYLTLQHLP
mmetsp:Transcript_23929/g.57720  ORF Transcript_23929/g.57720 Transcript_23929/m.57720 type:complete len:177 (-) Transcript_23929:48-578(-)